MSYNSKSFGMMIARLRFEKGLTQETASGLAGISRSHLVMLESGRKTVRLDTLWRIADALGVRPSEIIRMAEDEMNQKEERK